MRAEWAKRVRAARRAKGWTQKELADRAGTAQQTIGGVEAGLGLSDELKVRIAVALEVADPRDLFPLVVADEPSVGRAS